MVKFFFRICIAVIILITFSINLQAQSLPPKLQNKSIDSTKEKNSLQNGMWAIQFGISNNFTISNFEGAALSLKRMFSKHLALRLEIDGSYQRYSDDKHRTVYSQTQTFGTSLSLIYYLNPADRFNVYGSIGFKYNYDYKYEWYDNEYENSVVYETRRWATGPVLRAGAEYFIFEEFSVFAEYTYGVRFGKERYKQFRNFDYYIDEKRKFVTVGSESVKFGLSVYFNLF